jgi:hypothetical protein
MLWHFAHSDPVGDNGILPSLRQIKEIVYPHVDLHALHAVEALASGRLLPIQENPAIFSRRLAIRAFGTDFVPRYAFSGSPQGFAKKAVRWMRKANQWELVRIQAARLTVAAIEMAVRLLRPRTFKFINERRAWRPPAAVYRLAGWLIYVQSDRHFALPAYLDPNHPQAGAQAITADGFWPVCECLLQKRPAWCATPEIIQVDGQWGETKFVAFLNLVVATSRASGFDLGRELLEATHPAFWGTTVNQVREMLLKENQPTSTESRRSLFVETVGELIGPLVSAPEGKPVLLAILSDTNLVHFRGELLAVPHALGKVQFDTPESSRTAGVKAVTSRAQLDALVDTQIRSQGRMLPQSFR